MTIGEYVQVIRTKYPNAQMKCREGQKGRFRVCSGIRPSGKPAKWLGKKWRTSDKSAWHWAWKYTVDRLATETPRVSGT